MTDRTSVHPDQARLMLYLAGEMSSQERRSFEAVLAQDARLRQELDVLRQIESGVNKSLSAADASESISGRLPVIEKHVARALAQWQVDRLTLSAPAVPRTRIRRVPVWLYPLSAAAAVMVCLGVWWLSLETENVAQQPLNPPPAFLSGDPDAPFDLSLADVGSDTFSDLERDMAMLQTLNETLQ
jgi:anti-sigma factor RsiW